MEESCALKCIHGEINDTFKKILGIFKKVENACMNNGISESEMNRIMAHILCLWQVTPYLQILGKSSDCQLHYTEIIGGSYNFDSNVHYYTEMKKIMEKNRPRRKIIN